MAGNKLKLRLLGRSGIVSESPLPASQVIIWGAKSPAGWGTAPIDYTGPGTLSITGGNGSGLWAMPSNRLGTTGTYSNSSTTALSYGSGPYSLTVTDGTYSGEIVVIIAANTWSVMHDATDTSSANQLRTAARNAAKGDTISMRDDMVFNPDRGDWRIRRLANTPVADAMVGGVTSVADADWIKITSDTDKGAVIAGLLLEGNSQAKQGFWFYRVRFEKLYTGSALSGTLLTLGANTNSTYVSYVRVSECSFKSNTDTATQATSTQLLNGLRGALGAHEVWIHDNEFNGLYTGLNYTGTLSDATLVATPTNLWVIGNTFRNCWSDCRKTESAAPFYSRWNRDIDKRYGAGDVHGDFEQRLFSDTLAGTYAWGDCIGNLWIRGSGTPLFADGQGVYHTVGSSAAASISFTGCVVEGNVHIGTLSRSVTVTNCAAPQVRWNTCIRDKVSGVSISTAGIFLRSCTGTPVVDYNAVTASFAADTEERNTEGAIVSLGPISNTTNIISLDSDAECEAAFTLPTYSTDNDSFDTVLANWAMKTSGTLDLSVNVGAIGTGYVDYDARTTSFPS